MRNSVVAGGVLVAMLLAARTMAAEQLNEKAEVVEIPLKEIWGYQMPGTRDIEKTEARLTAKQWEGIRRALATPPPQGKEAGKGFAVVGSRIEALAEVHAVLVEGKKPRNALPVDRDVSIVFYSYQSSFYVHVHSVLRQGNNVEIRYRFVPHKSTEMTEHFALIPLGRITPGQVQVEVKQVPMPEEFIKAGWKPVKPELVKRIVCKSFSFVVE